MTCNTLASLGLERASFASTPSSLHAHTHTQSENYINVNYTGSTGNTANKAEPVYSNVPKEVSCTNTMQSLYSTCYSLSPALTAVMWSSRVLRQKEAGINVLSFILYT